MRAIAKSAKTHPTAKKCCGWEEPAICCMDKIHCDGWHLLKIVKRIQVNATVVYGRAESRNL